MYQLGFNFNDFGEVNYELLLPDIDRHEIQS